MSPAETQLQAVEGVERLGPRRWKGTLQDYPKGEGGVVPLSPLLQEKLRRLRAEHGEGSRFVLQRTHHGVVTHWSDRTAGHRVRTLQALAGIRVTGPHLIWHSTLTHMAGAGVSPYALPAFARHASMSTTMRDYVHLDKTAMAAQAVSAFLTPDTAPQRRGTRLATDGNSARNAHRSPK